MKFIRYPQYQNLTKPSVVTIGNFDGLHLGHQALINQVVDVARIKQLQSIVVSMQPMPSQYFGGKGSVVLLTPFKSKYRLIKQLNVDLMCVLNFNDALAELSPMDFIEKILIDGLNAQYVIIGDDFRFGKGRAGDLQLLEEFCKPKGISVDAMSSVLVGGKRVSSSMIRKYLIESRFNHVKKLMGRSYVIDGKVSKGQQLGRKLGYPTINVKLKNRQVGIAGIFCVSVIFDRLFSGQIFYGSASLGTRPTVNGVGKILEVFILDFNYQVYGENVKVLFHHKLRNEVKFEGIKELKRHIDDDVIKTRLFFENYND